MSEIVEEVAMSWLQEKLGKFIDQFDANGHRDESYESVYERNRCVLEDFYSFIDKESREKEERRKLYEELKKEFEKE